MWPQPIYLNGAGGTPAQLIYSTCATNANEPWIVQLPADVQDGDLLVQTCHEYWYQLNFSNYQRRVIPDATCISTRPYNNGLYQTIIAHKFLRASDANATFTFRPGHGSNGALTWFANCIHVFRGVDPLQPIRSVATNDSISVIGDATSAVSEVIGWSPRIIPYAKDSIPFVVMNGYLGRATTAIDVVNRLKAISPTPMTNIVANKPYTSLSTGWVATAIPDWSNTKNNLVRERNLLKNSVNNWGTDWTYVNAGTNSWPDASNGVMYPNAGVFEIQTTAEEEHCIYQDITLQGGKTYYLGAIINAGNTSNSFIGVSDGLTYKPAFGLTVEDDDGLETGAFFDFAAGATVPSISSATKYGAVPHIIARALTGSGASGYYRYVGIAVTPAKSGVHRFRFRFAWKVTGWNGAVRTIWSNVAGVTFTAVPTALSRAVNELYCMENGWPMGDGWESNLDSNISTRRLWPVVSVGTVESASDSGLWTLEITGKSAVDEQAKLIGGGSYEAGMARPGPYYDLLTDSIIESGHLTKSMNGSGYTYDHPVICPVSRGYVEGGLNFRYFEWEVVNFVDPGANESEIGFCITMDNPSQIAIAQADVGGGTYHRNCAKDDQTWVVSNVNVGDLAGTAFQNGDVFGFALDFENNRFWFYKNGVQLYEGNLYSAQASMRGYMWRPYAVLGFQTNVSQYRMRLRNTVYPPPEGFVVWDHAPGTTPPTYINTVKIYTSDDVWQKPVGLKAARLIAVGAGGGGGTGGMGTGNLSGGGGGGSGGWDEKFWFDAEIPAGPHAVTIGQGGIGGVYGTFANGYADAVAATAGEASSIGSIVTANGGARGANGSSTAAAGGAGGTAKWRGEAGGFSNINAQGAGYNSWNYGGGGGGAGGELNGSTAKNSTDGGLGGAYYAENNRPLGGANVASKTSSVPVAANDGNDGAAGFIVPALGYYMGGGGGGGGGGIRFTATQPADTGIGGTGGDGGWPGAGGGGGGFVRNVTNANQIGGAGGAGADGVVVVVEYFDPNVETDPNFADNILLLHAEGANAGTAFYDSSQFHRTMTGAGDVITSTAEKKYGASSLYFDGNLDYITTPYNTTQFAWWTQDFTVEAWVYAASFNTWRIGSGTIPKLIGNASPLNQTIYWAFGPSATGRLVFYYWNGGQQFVYADAGNPVAATGAWNHIALVHKVGSGIQLYINGVGNASYTPVVGTPQHSASYPLVIGQLGNGSGGCLGYVDEVRITRAARYTANFTPPAGPFPDF